MKVPKWQTNLLPLKALLFVFFGSFGCLWPFFTVHMKQLGLSIRETAIINLLLPFLSAFVAPILSTLIDRFGNYRRFLIIACILMGTLYSILLLVPPVVEKVVPMGHTNLFLACSGSANSLVMTSNGLPCWPKEGSKEMAHGSKFHLMVHEEQCSVLCSRNPLLKDVGNSSGVVERPLCVSNGSHSDCDVLVGNPSLLVKLRLLQGNETDPNLKNSVLVAQASHCFYNLEVHWILNVLTVHANDSEDIQIQCPLLPKDCMRVCPVTELNIPAVLTHKDPLVIRYSMLTFWVYIVSRAFADVLFCLSFPLTDAISITLLRQHGGSFGRQMLFGILALGVAGPIAGVLNDVYSEFVGRQDYMPCFMMFNVLMVLTIVFVCCMPFTITPQPKGVYRALLRLLKDIEVLALYIAVTTLGTNFGFLEAFLYWFLEDLGASQFLIGITWTVGVFPSLPFLWKSKVILEKVGHANLLAFAFFVYAIRYLGYSFIDDPWLCLPFEAIEVFTFFLTRATYCTYSALLTPPALMVTSQTMMVSLHLMIGKGLGSLVGGYMMASFGPRRTFRGAAGFCCICGVAYFLLYQLHIKAKAKKKREAFMESMLQPMEISNPTSKEVNANDQVQMQEMTNTVEDNKCSVDVQVANHKTPEDNTITSAPFLPKINGTEASKDDEDSIGYDVALANPYS